MENLSESTKKLLIVSYSYPPVNAPAAQRPYFLAKYLPKFGWTPVVLTPRIADSSLGHSNWADKLDATEIIFTGNISTTPLRAVKTGAFRGRSNGLRGRIAHFCYGILKEIAIPDRGIVWLPFAVRAGIRAIRKDPEIKAIFSTSPLFTNHIVAATLKLFTGLPWIADIRDFHYIENIENSDYRLRKPVDRLLETMIMNKADKTVFISETMRNYYLTRYNLASDKTHAVYNGFEPTEFEPHTSLPDTTPLTIFYAGSFYMGERSPMPLLSALENLIQRDIIKTQDIRIVIAGNMEGFLLDEMKHLNIFTSIAFLGAIARKKVLELMNNSHLLWLIIGEGIMHKAGFPIKGYEYLGARRTILGFVPHGTEAEKMLLSLGSGVIMEQCTSPVDIEKNTATLIKLVERYRDGALNDPLTIDIKKLKTYTRESQAEEIAAIANEICHRENIK